LFVSSRSITTIIAIAIVVATGHELHHLLLGDVQGSGVKTYFGLAAYALVLVLTLPVPLWLSGRLGGRLKKASLIILALFVTVWGLEFAFLGFAFGVVQGFGILLTGKPIFDGSSYLVSPWLGFSTALQFFAGLPLLVFGLKYAKTEMKRPLVSSPS